LQSAKSNTRKKRKYTRFI